MERVETVVIGGGQAGLAMSWHLARRDCEHVVLERARVAERWRTQRWDSLRFQFPNWSIELPGHRYAGDDPDGFSHRDEVVAFLEDYAARFGAPLRTGVDVRSLRPAANAGRYLVVTDQGDLEARNVVIATGPYQRPVLPPCASALPPGLVQLHAGEYRHPDQLPAGAVLVVGSGASGCQIADELVEAGRDVHLSVGRHLRVPRRYRGRDAFWWRRALGTLDETAAETPPALRTPPPLVTGVHGGYDVDLRSARARGMTLLGGVRGVRDGRIALADDLEENLRQGDLSFTAFKRAVDEFVERTGIDVPAEPGEPAGDSTAAAPDPLRTLDLGAAGIGAVVWATGYATDFGWIGLPVQDERGDPVHRRGVTACPGIFFLGLAWLHKRKSSFLGGVGEDAEHLADRIAGAAGRTNVGPEGGGAR